MICQQFTNLWLLMIYKYNFYVIIMFYQSFANQPHSVYYIA